MGVINVGGKGKIVTGGETYELGYKEALYLGKETSNVVFESSDAKAPAKFYINSALMKI